MELKKTEKSAALLTLTLKAKEIEDEYKKGIQDYAKKITIKGFRQGKAPVSLIESKYGDAIREELTFKLMEKTLEENIDKLDVKDKPLPYCTPALQDEEKLLPFKANNDITFTVKYDVMPQVKLPKYTELSLEAESFKVSAKEVDEEIERLRQQNAMVVAKNGAVEKGDIVTVDYKEQDKDGKEVANTKRDDFTFTVGSSYNFYKIDEDILGMKKGDNKVIEKTYGPDSQMGPEYLNKTVYINVTVKEVKYKDVPALDDEFAQDIKDEYKTLDDLKKATKAHLQEHADEDTKAARLDAVLKNLTENTNIEIPESMLEAQLEEDWREFTRRFGMKEDEVEKLMAANGSSKQQFKETRKADCIQMIKSQLIIEAVKEEQKFEVKDEEIKAQLAKLGSDIKEDDPNYSAYKEYVKDDLEFTKAKDFLVEKNTFKAPAKKAEKAEKA